MPSRTVRNPGFSSGPPSVAPVTRFLMIATLVVSLVGALTERKLGVGLSLLGFDVSAVLSGQLWRLFTYPLVESSPWSLIVSLVFLWLLGSWFERRFGARDFVRFFAVSSVGAAVLAVPLSFLLNLVLPFRDVGVAEGPDVALDAMLVAFAFTAPDANVLFGFVLPMRARTVVLVLLGVLVIFGVQTGAATLSTTLGGMAMGYLLVTGRWRPARIADLVRALTSRRRRGLYVVPPRDRTLH